MAEAAVWEMAVERVDGRGPAAMAVVAVETWAAAVVPEGWMVMAAAMEAPREEGMAMVEGLGLAAAMAVLAGKRTLSRCVRGTPHLLPSISALHSSRATHSLSRLIPPPQSPPCRRRYLLCRHSCTRALGTSQVLNAV